MVSANAVKLLLALVVAALALQPAAAAGKPSRPDLAVRKASLAGALAPGATVQLQVTVRNAGKRSARRSRLTVGLQNMRAPLARKAVPPIKPGKTAKVALAVRFPTVVAPGRYRIVVCADAARKVKERRETNNCRRLAQVLSVGPTVLPPVIPSGPAPPVGPPGPPAPPGTPTVTPTPTPTATATATPTATPDGEVPPEDLPPLIPSMADTAETLYDEQGVEDGAIAEERVGILHGRVIQVNGDPLAGVRVGVHRQPELGSTTTGADGAFDLAVNGGAQITLEYTRAGHLEVQRDVDPSQLEWSNPPTVVMLMADPAGAVIDPPGATGWTTARATPRTDADGTRTSTLLFAPGTTATMRFADGSTEPLPGPWTVRQTEYTSVGPPAMPGDLPPTSGYTYAAELAIDEADAAGADSVDLTAASADAPPAVNYVENFIGAPVGTAVPTGAYDRTDAVWEPSPNGRVVKVISESGGMAELDTDGDGDSDGDDYPPVLKLTEAERTTLAPLYSPGDELLRVPIPHMTPWDHNWAFGLPPDAQRPRLHPYGRLPPGCKQPGSSTIECEDQSLSEAVDVAGTPHRLSYSSDWEPGAVGSRSFDVPLTPSTLPDGLIGVELVAEIAGQTITRRYGDPTVFGNDAGIPAVEPDLVAHIDWGGLDGFGEPVVGTVIARLTLHYYYFADYSVPLDTSIEAFGIPPGTSAAQAPSFISRSGCVREGVLEDVGSGMCAFRLTAKATQPVGSVARTAVGLGDWDLDAHHIYDAVAGEVRLGDGSRRTGGDVELGRLRTVAGPGAPGSGSDPIGFGVLGVLPDGSILHGGGNVINRTPPGEAATPFVGNGSSTWTGACDGGPALERSIHSLQSMAVRPDGGVVIAIYKPSQESASGSQICEVTPDGRLVHVGGAPTSTCPSGNDCRGDGGPATEAPIQRPGPMTIAPDGSIYFLEEPGPTNGNRARVRRIDPTGDIVTVAGGGNPSAFPADPDGTLALDYPIREVSSLLALPDGTVLMADSARGSQTFEGGIIVGIGTDGVLRRYAGTFGGTSGYALDVDRRSARIGRPFALALGRDGSVYAIVESVGFSEPRRRVIRIRSDGVVVRAMGWGAQVPCPTTPTELESAVDRCGLAVAERIAIDGAGRPLFEDGTPGRVRRLEPTLAAAGEGERSIASEDGGEVWIFDASGRHLRTLDGMTGATLLEFGYDAAGRLLRAEDADGRKTLIERDGAGAPTAIVAPDGRRTTLGLNAAGKLSAITDPAGETRGLSYDDGGRLDGQQLPSGRESSYDYDADGRLVSATGAAGQTRQLERSEPAVGVTVVDVTTGEGRLTRYTVETTIGGGLRRSVETPSGALTELLVTPEGTRTLTLPSGETQSTTAISDKRFGAAVARVRSQTTTAPSGKSVTRSFAYGATLVPGDPFNPTELTSDMTGPGGVTRSVYTGATRELKTTTPAGREQTTTFDARGRPVAVQVGNPAAAGALAPATFEYGPEGALARVAQGAQVTKYERDASGRLTALVAADEQRLEFAYDAADRLIQRRYPGGRTYEYGHDEDGERTSRTLPSDRTHTFTPTGFDRQISAWTPPGGAGAYTAVRDDDELATSVTTPTGAQRTVTADSAGRVTAVAFPSAGRTAGYIPGSDRIGHYESTAAPGSQVQGLDPAFDGMRVTRLEAEGLSPAETTWAYDANLRHASTRLVSGADDSTLAYTRDADGVLTGVGPFTHEREGPNGSLSAITDGTGRTEETVDEVADLETRRLTVDGAERYRLELMTDATGRITGRREVAGASDHTYAYAYNAMGELTEVRRDGAVVESYAYDLDGDRTSQGATYDAGGKLTSRGGTSYTFDADGFLTQRGTDAFTYARSGELRSATVGGTTVAYAYDGLGRMVARVEGSATTRFVYGDPDSAFRISAARAPDGTLDRYLYGPRGNLYAILRGGERFHVASDQVGSPRVVVDSDGTVVKRLEYDAYGVTTDRDPAFFLPIGYAGGLADPVTGLVRFGLRDYEPESGRFTARDPAMFEGSPRSLYGYAYNSPVSFHDPGGTASLSGSAYLGAGGGGTIYFDPYALFNPEKPFFQGLCFEGGFGLGGGVEVDAIEDPPKEASLNAMAELAGSVGNWGAKVGGEFDVICGAGKVKLGVKYGPGQLGVDTETEQFSAGPAVGGGAKIEGKVGLKGCAPPPS